MSEPKKDAAPSNALATQIYVQLVANNTEVVEGAVKMRASAANLATLSLKLAEAFYQAEADAIAAKAPDTKYKLEGSDIASWMK